MKVLIIGAGGMLGYVTFQYLQEREHFVTGITKTKKFEELYQMDATDEKAIRLFLEQNRFDAIINCAALLITASEHNKCEAIMLNVWLPHFLERYCEKSGTYLVQVSTDGVFSGKTGNYEEDSPCDAASFYGRSKFLGEVYGNVLTVRSGFWGADANLGGQGLFHWFMTQKNAVSGYSKAIFNGVSNLEFAKFVDAAIQNHWKGIYHLCAAEPISKLDFLRMQARVFARHTEINQNSDIHVNRALKNTRKDILYSQISTEQMMIELREWIRDKESFAHYFCGEG